MIQFTLGYEYPNCDPMLLTEVRYAVASARLSGLYIHKEPDVFDYGDGPKVVGHTYHACDYAWFRNYNDSGGLWGYSD